MLKFGQWDLPGLDYFTSRNSFIGSKGELRFKLVPQDEEFTLFIWFGEKCFEKSTIEIEKQFELCEDSIYKINEYLTEFYNERFN